MLHVVIREDQNTLIVIGEAQTMTCLYSKQDKRGFNDICFWGIFSILMETAENVKRTESLATSFEF